MPEGDRRPYYALLAALALVTIAIAAPAPRAWLADNVAAPLRAQADPSAGGHAGYTPGSLAFWALAGLVLAWVAYDIVFARLGFVPDRRFFPALAPWLVAAPLAHALLAIGALPLPWSYLATEPPIYLTAAALVVLSLAAGRQRGALAAGSVVLLALLAAAAPHASAGNVGRVMVILALAAVPAAALAWAYVRLAKPKEGLATVALVVGAHALDGATTWMVLRDPFALGFKGFGEKNPFSLALIDISNGWPYFALKLALPLVLLWLVRREDGSDRARAFLLFAVFVLGFGPGTANLLQVMLS